MRCRGTSLVEVALLLTIVAMLAASGIPAARRYQDLAAVTSASEALVSLFARARLVAVSQGGARVVLTGPTWRAKLVDASGEAVDSVDVSRAYGVELELAGSAGARTMAYDALGLGRGMGWTMTLRRGHTVRALVVSAYGRVRRE